MWRTRAVLSLLYEELAGLSPGDAEEPEARSEALGRARRRARIVIALDWGAILALVFFGDRIVPLTLGPDERTVFTLAILAVAAHSGFRLGHLDKLRAVTRAAERLARRDPEI